MTAEEKLREAEGFLSRAIAAVRAAAPELRHVPQALIGVDPALRDLRERLNDSIQEISEERRAA